MLKGSRLKANDLAHVTSVLAKRVNWNAVREHAAGDVGKRSNSVRVGAVASLMLIALGLAAGAVVMYLVDPRKGPPVAANAAPMR
jgi:hypothetical protein